MILGQYWEKPWPVTSSTLAETEVSLPLSSPATVNTICNGNLDPDTGLHKYEGGGPLRYEGGGPHRYEGGRSGRQNMEQFQIVDLG